MLCVCVLVLAGAKWISQHMRACSTSEIFGMALTLSQKTVGMAPAASDHFGGILHHFREREGCILHTTATKPTAPTPLSLQPPPKPLVASVLELAALLIGADRDCDDIQRVMAEAAAKPTDTAGKSSPAMIQSGAGLGLGWGCYSQRQTILTEKTLLLLPLGAQKW